MIFDILTCRVTTSMCIVRSSLKAWSCYAGHDGTDRSAHLPSDSDCKLVSAVIARSRGASPQYSIVEFSYTAFRSLRSVQWPGFRANKTQSFVHCSGDKPCHYSREWE